MELNLKFSLIILLNNLSVKWRLLLQQYWMHSILIAFLSFSLHPTQSPVAALRRHRPFLALKSQPPLIREGVPRIKNVIKIECIQYCCKSNLHLTDKLFKRMITENSKFNFTHVFKHPTSVVSLGNKPR